MTKGADKKREQIRQGWTRRDLHVGLSVYKKPVFADCVVLIWRFIAVRGEQTAATSSTRSARGVSGGTAGGRHASMPTAAVLRQRQGGLGGQVGRDEEPARPGTDGLSAFTSTNSHTVHNLPQKLFSELPAGRQRTCASSRITAFSKTTLTKPVITHKPERSYSFESRCSVEGGQMDVIHKIINLRKASTKDKMMNHLTLKRCIKLLQHHCV